MLIISADKIILCGPVFDLYKRFSEGRDSYEKSLYENSAGNRYSGRKHNRMTVYQNNQACLQKSLLVISLDSPVLPVHKASINRRLSNHKEGRNVNKQAESTGNPGRFFDLNDVILR